MKTLKLTNKELRALEACLTNPNVCSKGCAFEEMQKSKKDCDECEFPSLVYGILEKIE